MISRLLIFSFFLFSIVFGQTQIAVVEFQGKGVSNVEASALTDRLVLELFRTGEFTVLERELLEKILEEQKFQLSGCNSTECLIEIGRLANVQEIVSGSVSKVGDYFSISARLISVETGEILRIAVYDYEGNLGELLITGMADISRQLANLDIVQSEGSKSMVDTPAPSRPTENKQTQPTVVSNQVQILEKSKTSDQLPKGSSDKYYGLTVGAIAGFPVYMNSAMRGYAGEPVFAPVFEILITTPYLKADNTPPLGLGIELGVYDFTGGEDGVGDLGLILIGSVIMSLTDFGNGGLSVEVGAGFLNSDLGFAGSLNRSFILKDYPIILKPFIKGYSRMEGSDYGGGNPTWLEVGTSVSYDLSRLFGK